jgi:hypothetical protein
MNKQQLQQQIEQVYLDILIELNLDKVDTYFAPEYIQVTDHITTNIDEFKAHLEKLKAVVKSLTIETFKDMLIDEEKQSVFLRYDVIVEKKDNSIGNIEVYAVFTFNDEGKVISCNELTKEYDEQVKGLGSI